MYTLLQSIPARAFTALAFISITGWQCRQKPAPPPLQHLRDQQATYTTYTGEPGQRKEVRLADSTLVILNGRSRLLEPDNFAQQHTLLLDGEAFFDAPHPLTVKTNILTISTQPSASFRVRSFEAQQGATAYLLVGKVKVSKSYHSATDNQPEILERGQMVLANKEIDLMEKETFQPAELESWLQGRLAFSNEPFMNAMRKLEDWYDTEISVNGDVLKAGNITGDFHNMPLTTVLEKLSKANGFRYKQQDDKVVIEL